MLLNKSSFWQWWWVFFGAWYLLVCRSRLRSWLEQWDLHVVIAIDLRSTLVWSQQFGSEVCNLKIVLRLSEKYVQLIFRGFISLRVAYKVSKSYFPLNLLQMYRQKNIHLSMSLITGVIFLCHNYFLIIQKGHVLCTNCWRDLSCWFRGM